MLKETRRWDMFLEQEICAPNRCCFVSVRGSHLPHCGPCVVTKHYELDHVRYLCHLMRKCLQKDGERNEEAEERWRHCVVKVMRLAVRKQAELYLSERERCVKQIVDLWKTGCHRDMTTNVCCPLCQLEIAHKMPGGLPIVSPRKEEPYTVKSVYSLTFFDHLQRYHWRTGYTCNCCLRIFPSLCSGKQHVDRTTKKCKGAEIIPLKGSWLWMRRRVMSMYTKSPVGDSMNGALARCLGLEEAGADGEARHWLQLSARGLAGVSTGATEHM